MSKRKSWDRHFMDAATLAGEMCTCASGRKVGAAIVQDKRVVSTGFNGVPAGYPHPLVCVRREQNIPSGEGLHKCACQHAEANAVTNAARIGISLNGATCYSTVEPCGPCMGVLANAGIKEIVFEHNYPHKISSDIAKHAGIPVRKLEGVE